jgi:DNA-binding protein HU-beta
MNFKTILLILSVFFFSNTYAMNKGELVDSIAKDANLSKADAKRALESLTTHVARSLKKGNSVQLIGMGTFSNNDGQADFDADLPMAKALYPNFVENFWSTVNQMNADAIRHHGHVTVLKNREDVLDGDNVGSRAADTIIPDRLILSRNFYGTQGHFSNAFADILTKESPAKMLGSDRDSYVEYLAGSMGDAARTLVSSQEIAVKASAENIKNAVLALHSQAIEMERFFLDPDSDNDSVDDFLRKRKFSEEQSQAFQRSLAKIVTEVLRRDERVSIRGFGTFSISNRAARSGRNPQTGATIQIKAKKVAKFKAGKALADTVK